MTKALRPCPKCDIVKPLSAYYIQGPRRYAYCIPCSRILRKENRARIKLRNAEILAKEQTKRDSWQLSRASLVQKLKEIRVEFNLSQEYVAEEIGTFPSHISKWERGVVVPSHKYAQAILKFLHYMINSKESSYGKQSR